MRNGLKQRLQDRAAVVSVAAIVLWLGSPAGAQAPDPSAYFPLAVGNRWVYEASTGSSTEEWAVIREEKDAFVVQITADALSTARFEEVFRPGPEGIARLTGAGQRPADPQPVINPKFRDQLRDQPQDQPSAAAGLLFVLKSPLRIGTVWENADGRYEVTGLGLSVSVPAGTFENCVEVMRWSAGGGVTVVSLYAPGVGVVQRDETFPLLEGSGNLNPRQRQRLVLQLKAWTLH